MKRPIVIVAVALPLILLLTFGSYWFLSQSTETGIKRYFEGSNPFQGAQMELASYEKGLFKSRATSSVALFPEEKPILLVNEIYHGPVAFTPGGIKVGSAHVVTTLNIESLPEKARNRIAEIYAGKEPLQIITDASLSGSRTSEVMIAPVHHDKEGSEIRFDGAAGTIEASGDNSRIEGSFTIQPVSMRLDGDETSVRIRMDQSTFRTKNTGETATLEASVGALKVTFKADAEQTLEMGGLEIRSDFSSAAPESRVMLGSGTITAPAIKGDWNDEGAGGKGELELKGLSIEMTMSESAGLVSSISNYRVDSLSFAYAALESAAPYLDELEKGMQFTTKATIPRVLLEDMLGIEESLKLSPGMGASSALSADQVAEMARLIEGVFRKVTAGTGFEVEIRAGSPDNGLRTSFAYLFQGSRPLTAQKTYLEIIENSEVRVEASVPKTFVDANPEMSQQVQGMLAMGAIKEVEGNFVSVMALKAGQLTANDEPFPLLENFRPILAMEIPWDAFFAGIQASAGASEE
jgi:hypothetical protein